MKAFEGYDIAQIPNFMNTLLTDAGFEELDIKIND